MALDPRVSAAVARVPPLGEAGVPPFPLLPLLLLYPFPLLLALLLASVSLGRVVVVVVVVEVVVVLGAEAARLSYSHCLLVLKLETHRRPLLRCAPAPIRAPLPLEKGTTENRKEGKEGSCADPLLRGTSDSVIKT